MNNQTYPVGNYNLDNKVIEVKTKNNKYYKVNPLAVTIGEDRDCCVLLDYEEYLEPGKFINRQVSCLGRVQLSKIQGYKYEIAVQFKGQRIHLPFYI